MQTKQQQQEPSRVVGFQLAQELSAQEMQAVSGGNAIRSRRISQFEWEMDEIL